MLARGLQARPVIRSSSSTRRLAPMAAPPTTTQTRAPAAAGAGSNGGGDDNRPQKTRILAVCLGNICRSPTAEAVLRAVVERRGLTDQFEIDSCGTGGGSANVELVFLLLFRGRWRKG
jgi:hypothetical protein